ncbi:MAG: UDP-3-O-(3-hydroxymyristoyl)glucosamine N-acyltransferase, partial [Verrucomicrobia bacterium]|nr:UDP-3-O-(3-hydroxymyristoyl)glucosamine N-acyltransferase [Verrucomicrobiota bacterium]
NIDLEISGFASLRDAQGGELSFFYSPRYLQELRQTKAAAILVPLAFEEEHDSILIKVKDPSTAFDSIIRALAKHEEHQPKSGIHPTALIASTAQIGRDVCIAAYAVIEEGVVIGDRSVIGAHAFVGAHTKIGEDSLLHPHVTVRERCLLGNRVILHPGVVIGSCGFGYDSKTGTHQKIPQIGIVQIEDDVEIGANTTIDRARFGRTHIGQGTKIDNLVQIAHNVVIGPHNIICAQVGISGSTRTGAYVTLAGQVGLSGHIEVGDKAIVGAQAGASKNIPAGAVMIGAPAKSITTWKQNNFYIHNLSKLFERVKALEKKSEENSPQRSFLEDRR